MSASRTSIPATVRYPARRIAASLCARSTLTHGRTSTRTPAEEEYLQTIYWLMEAELPITGANIARAMQLSPPTVHEMVGRLEQDGYVTRAEDKSLRSPTTGREQAEAIVGRHRLIERFLTDVVGIAWDDVHEEAEKLEHAMSPAFEKWMVSRGRRREDLPARPSDRAGQPHPRRAARGRRGGRRRRDPPLRERGRRPAALPQAGRPAAGPQGQLAVVGRRRGRRSRSDGDEIAVTRSVAETVSVRADPSPPPRTALPEQLVLGKERYGR